MKNSKKIQKQSISKTGSFVNFLMGNNSALPVVGKGATKLMWSDRHAYEVVWVNEDRSECIIQEYIKKRIDKNGMSESQAYEYKELDGLDRKVVWRNKQGGKWCFEVKEINFIPKWIKEVHEKTGNFGYAKSLSTVDYKEIYFKNGEHSQNPIKVVKGITKEYTRYYPVNILFGVKESYYDFTF